MNCAVCGRELRSTYYIILYGETVCHGAPSCARWAEAVRRERQYRRAVRREVVTAILLRAFGFEREAKEEA